MTSGESSKVFKKAFTARVRSARINAGYTQAELGVLLGLGTPQDAQGRYKQYEGRSLLPHALIPAFCLATGATYEWLFTGRVREASKATPKKRAA